MRQHGKLYEFRGEYWLTLLLKIVDLAASNLKLKQRSRNILRSLSGNCCSSSDNELDCLLVRCNQSVKSAILVAGTQV
jgi:N-acetylmuramic acid 6-phosphate etherase